MAPLQRRTKQRGGSLSRPASLSGTEPLLTRCTSSEATRNGAQNGNQDDCSDEGDNHRSNETTGS
jgi:hypothetical protein